MIYSICGLFFLWFLIKPRCTQTYERHRHSNTSIYVRYYLIHTPVACSLLILMDYSVVFTVTKLPWSLEMRHFNTPNTHRLPVRIEPILALFFNTMWSVHREGGSTQRLFWWRIPTRHLLLRWHAPHRFSTITTARYPSSGYYNHFNEGEWRERRHIYTRKQVGDTERFRNGVAGRERAPDNESYNINVGMKSWNKLEWCWIGDGKGRVGDI